MKIDKIEVAIEKWWINDVVEKRIDTFKVKIDDLFLVLPCPSLGDEGDTSIETSRGKLKVFFSAECPADKKYILHKSKYDYPRRGTPFRDMPDHTQDARRERIN